MAVQGSETMIAGVIKVVIVTYNSAGEIAACLDALLCSSTSYSFDITVVDNGSSDRTLQILQNSYPFVQTIASTNLGYAHGNNLAVREALASGQAYQAFLILNPDSTLGVDVVDSLVDALFISPEVGGVSPHIEEHSVQDFRRLKTIFGLPMNDRLCAGRDAVVSDRLHGCCMLLRPEVFHKSGYMDERYFLYWEELDFGLRMIAAGFNLLLCYDVLVGHGGDRTERQHRIYYMWRNQFLFVKNNYTPLLGLIFLSRRVPTLVKELGGFIASKRFDLVRAALAGLVAGFRGETGKSASRYAVPSSPD